MELAKSLKKHRECSGLSQIQVAKQLNLTRQSISKWENGRGYPDLDNLVLLSELYQVTVDELMNENKELSEQIQENKEKIKDKQQKIYYIKKRVEKEKDESLILLLLGVVSSFIFPIGLLISGFVMWKNKKNNSFYKLVYIVCLLALFSNLFNAYSYVNDILNWGEVSIEKIE